MIVFLILLRSIEDVKNFTRRDMDSLRSYFTSKHLVGDTYIGKSSSSHDEVVSSPGSICVEILSIDSSFLEETGSRRRTSDVACRGNMISSDGISKDREDICVLDGLDFGEFFLN